MDEIQIKEYTEIIIRMAVEQAPKILLALVVLILGWWIIKKITKTAGVVMVKRETDPSLIPFVKSVLGILLKVALVITVIGMMGIETTSFIAMLGAAGLAIGMALSGTLQNFAGGVILLLFKPFRVGDFVEVQGFTGTVHEIQIFNTILKTIDNKTVIIPNGSLANGAMTNYSTEPIRRVDLRFSIGYSDNIELTKSILYRIMNEDERILKDPAPFVGLVQLGNSSVDFVVRPWVNSENYWPVHFDMHEKVKKAFDSEGVSIPFPQMDVHLPAEKLQK